MKNSVIIIAFLLVGMHGQAQSFEVMPGTKRLFIDMQYLKTLDKDYRVSLFSRARATAAYDAPQTDLFTGAYLNYTTKTGVGGTVLGRIGSNSSGLDACLHFFKAKKNFMIYALSAVNLGDDLLYSWFSIFRYTPSLRKDWKLYSSLELFSAFGQIGHLSSVQRIRLGLDKTAYQFGAAVNINLSRFSPTDINPGVFLRKQF